MRKWKPFYHLRKKLKPILKNETGVTLVELLAAIAILGIIIALAGSVHIFGQRQFRSQTESAKQANDMSYALSVISTDLRRYAPGQVNVSGGNVIEILDEAGDVVSVYKRDGIKLKHNDSVLVDGVSDFVVTKLPDEAEENIKGVHIKIILNSTSPGVEAKDYQTTIYFRGAKPSENTESEDGGG